MASISPACQPLADQLAGLEDERRSLQHELKQAAPADRSALVSQIAALNRAMATNASDLAACIANNPSPPDPVPHWTAWESIAATPPSTVYPPDNAGTYFARTDLAPALKTQARGRDLAIVELRGWLTEVSDHCNGSDPDWHYHVELDVEWMRSNGYDPSLYLRPGDVLGYADEVAEAARRRARTANIEIELDAWPRTDATRGFPPQPADWITPDWAAPLPYLCQHDDGSPVNATWPWNPLMAKNGTLAVGQYLRIVGSAVTDHPHERSDSVITNMILNQGIEATRAFLLTFDPGNAERRLKDGASSAAKWIFSEKIPPEDPANPSRWNEIHSPDYIEILEPKPQDRRLHQVMVCAQNGLLEGTTEQATLELPGPPARKPNSRLRYHRHPTAWTRGDSVKDGPHVTVADDHITVSVTVQGDGGWGHSGRYYELYEVWSEDVPLHTVQWGWRFCTNCRSLFYGPEQSNSVCPTGGEHQMGGAPGDVSSVGLMFNQPATPNLQTEWRYCDRCRGLFYNPGQPNSVCPAGGHHSAATDSYDYGLALLIGSSSQTVWDGWYYCSQCQGLFLVPADGSRCPAGGEHLPRDPSPAGTYYLHVMLPPPSP